MHQIRFVILFLSLTVVGMVSAYSVSCSSVPGSSGCQQCFHFDLAASNKPSDVFVPRSGLTSGQQEVITQSSITAQTYQGATVTPTGNITNLYDITSTGVGQNSWIWAKMKAGNAVIRGGIPSTTDYSQPVYSIRYLTTSSIQQNGTPVSGTEVTHLECGYFFAAPPAAVCGDGILASTEQCDDGNTNNNDSCTNSCTIGRTVICGNGIIEGQEACDDGNTNNNDSCSNLCKFPICGNSIREGSEQCDDGNRNNGDNCRNDCRYPQTVDGGSGDIYPVCGNGIREGSEDCDDGNTNNDDACTNSCRNGSINTACRVQALQNSGPAPLTTSFSCSGEPRLRTFMVITKNNVVQSSFESSSAQYTFNQVGRYTLHCYPDATNQSNNCKTTIEVGNVCGNNVREGSEQCDDGINNGGGGCTRDCRFPGSPGAICGNGIREYGEECDQGRNNGTGVCSKICQKYTSTKNGPENILLIALMFALAGASYMTYRKFKKV